MTKSRRSRRGSKATLARVNIAKGMRMFIRPLVVGALMTLAVPAGAQTTDAPLELEAKIPLGRVSGRIDHLALDLKRQLLLVAELENDTLGVLNLSARKVQSTMFGPNKPQG